MADTLKIPRIASSADVEELRKAIQELNVRFALLEDYFTQLKKADFNNFAAWTDVKDALQTMGLLEA